MSHTMSSTDQRTLFDLNAAYVNAYLTRDAAWYHARLVEDFISYARLGGEWKCVCAQLTAIPAEAVVT